MFMLQAPFIRSEQPLRNSCSFSFIALIIHSSFFIDNLLVLGTWIYNDWSHFTDCFQSILVLLFVLIVWPACIIFERWNSTVCNWHLTGWISLQLVIFVSSMLSAWNRLCIGLWWVTIATGCLKFRSRCLHRSGIGVPFSYQGYRMEIFSHSDLNLILISALWMHSSYYIQIS